jgi:hypothetical protein
VEVVAGVDDGAADAAGILGEPGGELRVGDGFGFLAALRRDEEPDAAGSLREPADLRRGQRFFEQVALTDVRALVREELPRVLAAGSPRLEVEFDVHDAMLQRGREHPSVPRRSCMRSTRWRSTRRRCRCSQE